MLRGIISGQVDLNYCSELVRVVTSSGANKGYANRLSQGSGYINDDSGVIWDAVNNTNMIVQCNDAEQQKCAAKGYDQNNPRGKYPYYKPFDYQDFLDCPCLYQSSDYQPFGALVSPRNAQYPTAWDAKASQYNQPLLYEPPRFTFAPPHQARMGELHTPGGLKQIFARAYGIWHWEPRNPDKFTDGGLYKIGPLEDVAPTELWDLPVSECVDGL